MASEIVIVSGLPRSGTSLMMQMLDVGGMEVVTDKLRVADTDNPKGYYEFERVKSIKRDTTWLPATRGKAFKMISQLLFDLPATETYRVIFMNRNLDETLDSQEKMLRRLGQPAIPRDDMKRAYLLHLARLHDWLDGQKNMAVIRVHYNDLLEQPRQHVEQLQEFLTIPVTSKR